MIASELPRLGPGGVHNDQGFRPQCAAALIMSAFISNGHKTMDRRRRPLRHTGRQHRPYALKARDFPAALYMADHSDVLGESLTNLPNMMLSNAVEPVTTFEPILPDTSALAAMGSVLVLCIIAGLVWANEVVPVSRTKLAISKNRGEVKDYLDELREGELDSVDAEDTSSGIVVDGGTTNAIEQEEESFSTVKEVAVRDGRDFERWLFSDWLTSGKSNGAGGRKKEPAIPVLKNAKWNSGDNPVLVASALIGASVTIASITERVSTQF